MSDRSGSAVAVLDVQAPFLLGGIAARHLPSADVAFVASKRELDEPGVTRIVLRHHTEPIESCDPFTDERMCGTITQNQTCESILNC